MRPTKKLVSLLLDERNWHQLSILVRTGMLHPNWERTDAFERFSLLHSVISREGSELAIEIIKAGAKVNYIEGGWSPLMLACQLKLHNVIDALIMGGANVNLKAPKHHGSGSGGHTALICAAEEADLWAVRRLIDAGADVNAVTRLNESALFWAGFGGGGDDLCADLTIAKELLKAGAQWRGNELHLPVLRRDFRMAKYFVDAGCNVNGKLEFISKSKQFPELEKGDTPLITAVRHTHTEMTRFVAGAQIAKVRQTLRKAFKLKPMPSFARLRRQRLAIINLLLEKGADPTVQNAKGEDALDVAARNLKIESAVDVDSSNSTVLKWLQKPSSGKTKRPK